MDRALLVLEGRDPLTLDVQDRRFARPQIADHAGPPCDVPGYQLNSGAHVLAHKPRR